MNGFMWQIGGGVFLPSQTHFFVHPARANSPSLTVFVSTIKACLPPILPVLSAGSCKGWVSTMAALFTPSEKALAKENSIQVVPKPQPTRVERPLINKTRAFSIAFHLWMPTILRE